MPPQLALLIAALFVLYVLWTDSRRNVADTRGLLWPTLWYMVVSSRFFGYWMNLWGIPLPGGGSGDATEGSSIDRNFFLTLIFLGLWHLYKQRLDWGRLLRKNSWLTALLAFMALSILWSDYPFVSFKRYIKVVGSIVMALVILTNDRPLDAFFAVLRRCLYVHLPMSIICTKYFRYIGVAYDWSGSGMWWAGISTSKNTLGQVAMLGVLYFSFQIYRNWSKDGWRTLNVPYLLMAIYLLKGGTGQISLTSVSVCIFAVLVFLRIQTLRKRSQGVRRFVTTVFWATVTLITLVIVHSVFHFSEDSFFGQVITKFGRNITLTDRTYIWSDVYAAVDNPLIGVGFGGFWIGRIANIPWNSTMTWVLGQAHSGYVDTYLHIGLVGAFLLTGVIFSTLPKLLKQMAEDFDFGCFRITLFLTVLFINITETTVLRGDHHLWMMFMVVLWQVPSGKRGALRAKS